MIKIQKYKIDSYLGNYRLQRDFSKAWLHFQDRNYLKKLFMSGKDSKTDQSYRKYEQIRQCQHLYFFSRFYEVFAKFGRIARHRF